MNSMAVAPERSPIRPNILIDPLGTPRNYLVETQTTRYRLRTPGQNQEAFDPEPEFRRQLPRPRRRRTATLSRLLFRLLVTVPPFTTVTTKFP